MSYIKQNFTDGQVLNAEHLNYIEEGISQLSEDLGNVDAAIDAILTMQNSYIGGEDA